MTGTDPKNEQREDQNDQERGQPMSEWMKVMLEEIERKRVEREEAVAELVRRGELPARGADPEQREPDDPSSER